MEPGLKVFLLLGFIAFGGVNIVSYIFIVQDGISVLSLLSFIISIIGLMFVILKIMVFEKKNDKEEIEIIRTSRSTIFKHVYVKSEWDKLSRILFKKEVYDFCKFFIPTIMLLVLFLICISGDGVFYLFFYLFILIIPPVTLANYLKFKKRSKVYFKSKEPTIVINKSGVLINNEVGHYFGYEVYDAKIISLKKVDFIEICTFNPAHRGGIYRSIFVPVPENYVVNIKEVILKLKDLKWR